MGSQINTHTHSQVTLLPLNDNQQWAWVSSHLLPFTFTHRLGTNSVQFPATKLLQQNQFCLWILHSWSLSVDILHLFAGLHLETWMLFLSLCDHFCFIQNSVFCLFSSIYSKNKLNKLIYLKTECFSRFFCGCTVNFVHCVSPCPTEEHFAFCISF